MNITVNNTNIQFNNGNPNLGYNVYYWNGSGSNNSVNIETIGTYVPGDKISLPQFPKERIEMMRSENVS